MTDIHNARILIIATDGFEQSELEVPRDELRAKGAKVDVATLDGQPIRGWDKKDWGREAPADLRISTARAADYDAIVIPGGVINPDKLRKEDDAVALVRQFAADGRVVAAICHGPWLLVEAGVLKGRDATSVKNIATDVKNAGANWQDAPVVTDKGIITSRTPEDLPAFVDKIVEEIGEGRHRRAA